MYFCNFIVCITLSSLCQDLQGIRMFAESLRKNTRLEMIDLQNCEISLNAASTLASLVSTSKTLQLIRLDACEIPIQFINGEYPRCHSCGASRKGCCTVNGSPTAPLLHECVGNEYVTTLEIAPPDLQKAQQIMDAIMSGVSAKDAVDGVASASASVLSDPPDGTTRSRKGKGATARGSAFATPTLSTSRGGGSYRLMRVRTRDRGTPSHDPALYLQSNLVQTHTHSPCTYVTGVNIGLLDVDYWGLMIEAVRCGCCGCNGQTHQPRWALTYKAKTSTSGATSWPNGRRSSV